MTKTYDRYIDWLNTQINVNTIKDWEQLSELKRMAQGKIKTEGQRQFHEKIWGIGDIKELRPEELTLAKKWDELQEKDTATERKDRIMDVREEAEELRIPLPKTKELEITPALEKVELEIEERKTILERPITLGVRGALKRDPDYLTGITNMELRVLDDAGLLGARDVTQRTLEILFPTYNREEGKNLKLRIKR